MRMGSSQLLAAASFAVDLNLEGCRFHGWRVGILACRIAGVVAPDLARDVFYAGLLHDAAEVGLDMPAISGATHALESRALVSKNSSALLRWLPGMDRAADCLAASWDQEASLELLDRDASERSWLGGQIVRLADTVDEAKVFDANARLAEELRALGAHTGSLWTKEVWGAFVELLRSSAFFHSLRDTAGLPQVMGEELERVGVPSELVDAGGADRVLHLIAALVDIKDPSTAGHSLRTAKFAKELARVIGLSNDDCETVYRAGLVHDCGRLGIPSMLLRTSGRLDERRLQTVRRHASMTISAMNCLPGCDEMAQLGVIAGHDHERYDGTGYPDQLAGEGIPMLSRVLSVCDAYDAMVTPRDYRMLSPRAGIVRLRQGAGTQFDPAIVEAMVKAAEAQSIPQLVAEPA